MEESKSEVVDIKDKIKNNISNTEHIIMVMSGKGGVGKSTVASNIAVMLSSNGEKVGLLDIDIHGPNLPKMFGVDKERMVPVGEDKIEPVKITDNLKLVSMAFLLEKEEQAIIWRGPLKMKVIQQFLGDIHWGDIKWLIVDAPPGTGDEPLSMAQLMPATSAIIVTTPQEVSILDVKKSIYFARKLNLKILGVVENMSVLVCPHCGKEIPLFKEGGGEKIAEELNVPFLGSIPIDPEIVNSTDSGSLYVNEFPDSEVTKAFSRIVDSIMKVSS